MLQNNRITLQQIYIFSILFQIFSQHKSLLLHFFFFFLVFALITVLTTELQLLATIATLRKEKKKRKNVHLKIIHKD